MGHDWLDVLLYSCNSCVLLFPPFVLVLGDGQLLMGSDSCRVRRIRKEDDSSCKKKILYVTVSDRHLQDEGKFDPRAIPLKSWSDYVSWMPFQKTIAYTTSKENELWDKESNHSIGSWAPPTKLRNDGYPESRTASLYGRETYYEPRRSFSPALSQPGPPAGFYSGRNTPSNLMHQDAVLIQPTPSRPVTNYLDFPIPMSSSHEELGAGPSDAELGLAVQNMLRGADLNSVTKREVRRQLEEHFGMDLTSRKATINDAIDRTLLQFGQN